jgi:hypothetical protein
MPKFACAAVSAAVVLCSLAANAKAQYPTQNPNATIAPIAAPAPAAAPNPAPSVAVSPTQDYSLALTMKLDQLVEQLPVGRYKVTKTAIDAQGAAIGKPLRDGHICMKSVGQIAEIIAAYATTFDLSIMAWKAEGASCRSAYHGDDASTIHETMCATTAAMKAPSRWNVLEPDASCKVTYTDTSRQRTCNEVGADVVQVATAPAPSKQMSSNHYLSGAISVPGKSLRVHLREFDTSATTTKFIAGHSVIATLTDAACEVGDHPATSVVD